MNKVIPGSFLDSMNDSGDWFSSCLAVLSRFFTKARICSAKWPLNLSTMAWQLQAKEYLRRHMLSSTSLSDLTKPSSVLEVPTAVFIHNCDVAENRHAPNSNRGSLLKETPQGNEEFCTTDEQSTLTAFHCVYMQRGDPISDSEKNFSCA